MSNIIIIKRYTGHRGHLPKILSVLEKSLTKKNIIEPPVVGVNITNDSVIEMDKPKTWLSTMFPGEHIRRPIKVAIDDPFLVQKKEDMLTYLKYIEQNNLSILLNDKDFINWCVQTLKNNPSAILSRQGQVTAELLFSKRKFSEKELQNLITDFFLVDILQKNNGITDITTVQNLMFGKALYEMYPEFQFIDIRVIVSTYLSHEKINYYQLPDTTIEFLKKSKNFTGNTICDASIADIPFDYKPFPSVNKNYITFWPIENFQDYKHAMRYINDLERYLYSIRCRTPFQDNLYMKLLELKISGVNVLEKQHILNKYIILNIKNMSPLDRISLLVPIPKNNIMENQLLHDKINVSPGKDSVDTGKTKKNLQDYIKNEFSVHDQKKIEVTTGWRLYEDVD